MSDVSTVTASNHSIMATEGSSPVQPRGQTDQIILSEDQNKRLDEACAAFESLFIYHMLKEMRASVPADGYLGTSMQSKTYTSLFDMEIARELANQRGIGLADFLRQQLADRFGDSDQQNVKNDLDFY